MLIHRVFVNLLLSNSTNHFFFLGVKVAQFGHQLNFLIVVHLQKALSFLFFKSSPLSQLFVFLILLTVVFIALCPQIVLSSLPQVLLFFLGNDIKTSSLGLNDKFVLLHHNVVVLLLGSLNCLHVGGAARAAIGHKLFNLVRVEPQLRLLEQAEVRDGHGHSS